MKYGIWFVLFKTILGFMWMPCSGLRQTCEFCKPTGGWFKNSLKVQVFFLNLDGFICYYKCAVYLLAAALRAF